VTPVSAARQWCRSRHNRWLLGAVIVAFVLRLAWALWATRTPTSRYSDPAQYLQLAVGFADRRMPTIGSHATSFWPPGWPLALAPFAWLSAKSGWFSLELAASLLNVVAGTATVVGVAALASRWIGPTARNPVAWLMALAAGPIYYTSSALSETWFTFVWVLVLVAVTEAVRLDRSTRSFAVVGAVIGYAVLIRTPGAVLFAAPALAIRATRGSWRGALRPTLAAVVGACVLLVPWTVRSGLQVGVWTPTSTNNAAFLCIGNRPGASGVQETDVAESTRCYRGSPFDDPSLYQPGEFPAGVTFTHPDEAEWYPRTLRQAIGWAATHPLEQPRLLLRKAFESFGSDADAVSIAEDFGRQPLVGTRTRTLLRRVADIWYWGAIALAGLGLATLRRCRQALPLWVLPAVSALFVGGIGLPRYHEPMMPHLALLAGATIAALRAAGGEQREPSAPRELGKDEDEAEAEAVHA
jgi:hypothetical protein